MYSCEDLERFYFQYESKALHHEESPYRFVIRIKPLITFFKNGLKIPEKVVEVKIESTPVTTHKEKLRIVFNLKLYQNVVMTIPFEYGLTFVLVMNYTCPKRI